MGAAAATCVTMAMDMATDGQHTKAAAVIDMHVGRLDMDDGQLRQRQRQQQQQRHLLRVTIKSIRARFNLDTQLVYSYPN